MAAFELAMEEGADGIELDVRLDNDGDVVVIHDPTLARVTDGRDTRRIEEVGRRDLSHVDLGGGETVPRLADVLAWAKARGARINIELKADVARRPLLVWSVVKLVGAEPHAAERLILSSFDPRLGAAVAHLMPWVPTGWLVQEPSAIPGRSLSERLVGACAVHPQSTLVTESAIAPWQRAYLPVNVWTVNDPDEARRLDALRVDCLISDEPGLILRAVGG